MRTLAFCLSLALLFGLSACSKPDPMSPAMGKWGVDIESVLQSEKFKSMPPDQQEFAKKMATEFVGKMTFEFMPAGKMVVGAGGKDLDTTYVVDSVNEAGQVKLTTTAKTEKGERKETVELTFTPDGKVKMLKGADELTLIKK